ncbi:TRAP transporter small permease [Roseovarius sp.]|uniref:TRAP transporter small permease n=1 Tax=Roseovarius sp. TaxID=1486281 RepID=UPI003B596A65
MKRILHYLDRFEQLVIGILLLGVTVILFGNVVLRYLFNSNLGWAEEMARYGVVWITMIGTSVCISKGGHISVDAISARLSERGKDVQQILVLACGTAAAAIGFYYSMTITLKVTSLGQMSSTLNVPMTFVYGAMPVGFFLAGLRFATALIVRIAGRQTRASDAS